MNPSSESWINQVPVYVSKVILAPHRKPELVTTWLISQLLLQTLEILTLQDISRGYLKKKKKLTTSFCQLPSDSYQLSGILTSTEGKEMFSYQCLFVQRDIKDVTY